MRLLPVYSLLICLVCAPNVLAQPQTKSSFETISSYAEAFVSLDSDWRSTTDSLKKQVQLAAESSQRFSESVADVQSINRLLGERYRDQLSWKLFEQEQESNIQTQLKDASLNTNLHRVVFLRVSIYAQGMAKVNFDNVQQQLRQLDLAGTITAERQLKILAQLRDDQDKVVRCLATFDTLIERYLLQADLMSTRSDLEHKGALRALHQSDADNVGARLAASVELLRLNRLDEALELLQPLDNAPPNISLYVSSIRGEIAARQGKKREAMAELFKTNKSNQPIALALRARTFEVLKESSNAQREWERLGKDSALKLNARTCLALSQMASSDINGAKVLQECRIIDDLAGGSQWLCKMAFSHAQARNKDYNAAATTAEEAARLAIGDKKQLCLDIAEKFKAGQDAKWQW
jgi:hypothetical protein